MHIIHIVAFIIHSYKFIQHNLKCMQKNKYIQGRMPRPSTDKKIVAIKPNMNPGQVQVKSRLPNPMYYSKI